MKIPSLINRRQAEHFMLKKLNLLATCVAVALVAGCGGGSAPDNSAAEAYTVDSGVAQKGPLAQGSVVWINELARTTYQPNGKEYTFRTNNDLGTFTPSGIKYSTPYLSTLAQGYYYNEVTGMQSDDVVVLSGLSQIAKVGTDAADTAVNVNVLSSMAVNRTLSLATPKPAVTFAAARARAQKETLGAFYIYNGAAILTGATVGSVVQPANLTALDLSKSRAGDQMLAAISGVVMQAGVNGAGVNALLSRIAVDLGDDGLLNNSTNYTPSVQTALCAAAVATDFGAVAANLNRVYGTSYSASDLSQWVDTSGCVDQVINKYKFSASNVAAGTESKSPAYVAGPDDVGQCFSVGGVSGGATANLYHQGSTTGVVGTQKVALGDSLTVGISAGSAGTYSAFMQRSAPSATGVCPSITPTTGLMRVQKQSAQVGSVIANKKGYTLTNIGGFASEGSAIALQPDGKIIVTGRTLKNYEVTTVRYLADGSIDRSFGTNGISSIKIAPVPTVSGLLLTPAGKILIYGFVYYAGASAADGFALQLTADGSADGSFGNQGLSLINSGRYEGIQAATIDSNGKIVLAGSTFDGAQGDSLLTRLNSDGSTDNTFNSGQFVKQNFPAVGGSGDAFTSVHQLNDGKILAFGTSAGPSRSMARYLANGQIDTSFGTNGIAMFPTAFPAYSGLGQGKRLGDGTIVVTFTNAGDFILTKFASDGSLVQSFGQNGLVATDFGGHEWLNAIDIQADGKIVAVGGSNAANDIVAARYLANGAIDTTFGTEGKVHIKIGTTLDAAYGVKIDANGKILIVGYTDLNYITIRLNTDGSFDQTFGDAK